MTATSAHAADTNHDKTLTPTQHTVLMAHPGAELYGADRMFLESVQGVLDAGARVVACIPNTGPLVPLLRRVGADVRIIPTPVLRKTLLTPAGLGTLAKQTLAGTKAGLGVIRKEEVNAFYVNTVTIPLWIGLARISKKPVTVHVHEAESGVSQHILRALNLPLKFANTVLVNSEFSKSVLAAVSSKLAERAQLLPNGIKPSSVTPNKARTALTGTTKLVFLGRLSERKGVRVAIEAFDELINRGENVELTLLGDFVPGYDDFKQEILTRIQASPQADKITVAGFIEPIWPELDTADIILTPSVVDEPFGNTAIEGVLAARPVIVANAAGLKETAHNYESVTTCEPGNPTSLADAVQTITSDWDTYREHAWNCRAKAAENHAPANYRQGIRDALGVNISIPRQTHNPKHNNSNHTPDNTNHTTPKTTPTQPQIVIAACTFKRNELLPNLIPALIAEAKTLTPPAKVLIVDNDPNGGARKTCEELLGDDGWYAHEPEGAISEARNKCLEESISSGADAMVFIDDDEKPEPGWLKNLVDMYVQQHCVGVVGPVSPKFTSDVPQWINDAKLFYTARRKTGTRVPMAATNNLLLDLKIVDDLGLRFDTDYSFTGGGDSKFTWTLTRMGHEIVWVDEAIVHDLIPAERLTAAWVVRRAVRLANSRPRVDLQLTQCGPLGRTAIRGRYLFGGLARLGVGTARAVAGAVVGSGWHSGRGLKTAARGIGMVTGAVGLEAAEYKRTSAASKSA